MRSFIRSTFATAIGVLILASAAQAQDLTISDELRARIVKFAEENPLAGGTTPEGWRYTLPEGITTAQVTWYSDDAACYAKMFYPRDFDPSGSYPGVVLGHGTNAITLAMEKYGPVFAEHGLVVMVMDYRTYGFSEGSVILQEPDTTTDEQRITEKVASVVIKRTRLLTPRQAEDYRNAISYLQGEPGVDPERIGIWGSSLSGGTVVTVANMDARVKAVVAQVAGGGAPRARRAPRAMSGRNLEDAIMRARTGQGGEYDAGFSIRTKVDNETRQSRSDLRNMGLMPKTTAVLFLPAENDELIALRGPKAGAEYYKDRGNPTAIVVIPAITHFQAYAGPPFEATSTLAARWFAHHLKAGK